MKWTTILLAATTGGAAAASVDDLLKIQAKLPKCSVGCIASGAQALGCNLTDFECQCNNYEASRTRRRPAWCKWFPNAPKLSCPMGKSNRCGK